MYGYEHAYKLAVKNNNVRIILWIKLIKID